MACITLTTSTSPYSDPSHAIYYVDFDRPERVVRMPEIPGGLYTHPREHVKARVITVGDEEIADVLDYHYGVKGWVNLGNIGTYIDPPEEWDGPEWDSEY